MLMGIMITLGQIAYEAYIQIQFAHDPELALAWGAVSATGRQAWEAAAKAAIESTGESEPIRLRKFMPGDEIKIVWEYKCIWTKILSEGDDFIEQMNESGAEGWEVFAVDVGAAMGHIKIAFMKRRVNPSD